MSSNVISAPAFAPALAAAFPASAAPSALPPQAAPESQSGTASGAVQSETRDVGLAHYVSHADDVGLALFAILVLMSLLSWTLILTRGAGRWLLQRRSGRFLQRFWNASSLDMVRQHLSRQGEPEPFGRLTLHAMDALSHHARYGAERLQEAGSAHALLTRTIKKVLDEETLRMESGLTALATIGATAPFVGLFGTVWGVYHALTAIGFSGSASLEQVATPVGEALIMTGLGLAVALPAVVAYNWLTRSNRVWLGRLDAFAYELLNFLSTGQPVRVGEGGSDAAATNQPHGLPEGP